MDKQYRKAIPQATQTRVYFRDGWLCHICLRPVVFHLSLRYLAQFTAERGISRTLTYWDARWRRDISPLLNELGASIDHVVAFSTGGAHDEANFATICARCNSRKSIRSRESYLADNPQWQVTGRYGEPTQWDGLSMAFLAFARDRLEQLSPSERAWYNALLAYATSDGASGVVVE